jgi:hypothetical protein
MRVFYCDHYEVTLPAGHRFPMGKYRAIRDRLVEFRRLVAFEEELPE